MRANIKAFMVILLQTGMIMDVDDHPMLPLVGMGKGSIPPFT